MRVIAVVLVALVILVVVIVILLAVAVLCYPCSLVTIAITITVNIRFSPPVMLITTITVCTFDITSIATVLSISSVFLRVW